MSWQRWLLLAGALLAIGAAGASVMASDGSPEQSAETPDVVMGEPSMGDAAAYTVTGSTDEGTEENVVVRGWNDTTYELPDGSTRTFLTHQTASGDAFTEANRESDSSLAWDQPLPSIPAEPTDLGLGEDRAAETEVSSRFYVTETGYEAVPGDPVVDRSLISFVVESEEFQSFLFDQRTSVRDEAGPCEGPIAPQLVERTPAQAETVLLDCARDGIDESEAEDVQVTVDSTWTAGERFEDVWQATVTVQATIDGETHRRVTTLATSPSASVVLERTIEVQEPGHQAGEDVVVQLDEWEPGEEAIPEAPEPVPAMPTVSQVPWGVDGPSQDPLELFPIAHAKTGIDRTSEGTSYFEDAEDPRLERAQFVVQERDAGALASTHTRNGVACQEMGAQSPALPEQGDRLHWDMHWTDPDEGELWGQVTSTRIAQDNPLDRRAPPEEAGASRFDATVFEDARPTLAGPSLSELWSQRDLADAFKEEGARTIGVQSGLQSLGEPRPLEGFVGLADCVNLPQNAQMFEQALVSFSDGTAETVQQTTHFTIFEGQTGPVATPGYDGPLDAVR